MTTNKFLTVTNGIPTLTQAITSSTGASDGNKSISTDSSGKLHSSFLPTGVELQTVVYPTSENLAAGDFVNIFNSSGTPTARKADATNGRRAMGYVLTAVTSPANATVYLSGTNTAVTVAATQVGDVYLAATGGFSTSTPSPGVNVILQRLGSVTGTNAIVFESDPVIALTV